VRRIVSLLLPVLFAATACGGTSTASNATVPLGTLADVSVSGPTSAKPRVDFKAPIRFAKTQSKIVDPGPGKGEAIGPTSRVTIDYVGINASDGADFDSSWARGKPATFYLGTAIAGLSKGLQGAHTGDRVLIGVTSHDGYDPTGNGTTIQKGDSLVFVVDVRKVFPSEATGTKQPVPATVPKLVYDKAGHPAKFVSTPQTPATVSKLGVYPIIQGHGPVVKSGQTIAVEYIGELYPEGQQFAESWTNPVPFSTSIGTGHVLKGWDQGLVGQHVGSRVILVVPSALGYGTNGNGSDVPPNADLIFAIDILQAS
jgi:peptidylprolyl isomerase